MAGCAGLSNIYRGDSPIPSVKNIRFFLIVMKLYRYTVIRNNMLDIAF